MHRFSARMFDYFDAGIMEGLHHRLVNMTEVQTQGNIANASGNTVSLHSKVGHVMPVSGC
jgi:zinc finger protein AEBP2